MYNRYTTKRECRTDITYMYVTSLKSKLTKVSPSAKSLRKMTT